jgi:hypothetical protein
MIFKKPYERSKDNHHRKCLAVPEGNRKPETVSVSEHHS